MLALHQQPGRLRYAHNLLPTLDGTLASRPSAIQIIAGDIAAGVAWGNRVLAEKAGRLLLWDGAQETDIAPAGRGLVATSFQAPTQDAARENRLYVADGVNPLWYIARRDGGYRRHGIVNSVRDADGQPYPIPIATTVANWRNRLWTDAGINRVQHCQNNGPETWDPLWTPELQGAGPDRVTALEPHGAALVIGLTESLWTIRGDSQFNWTWDELVHGTGAAGPHALASDDQNLYGISKHGVHQLGRAQPLSEDLRDWFDAPVYPAECLIDPRRRHLLCLALNRLFVMHLDKPGQWGEITGHNVRGLLGMDDYVGWYGADGAWILGALDEPDRPLTGSARPFTSTWDTWDERPNLEGAGRAHLPRTRVLLKGSARAAARYTVMADARNSFSAEVALSDEPAERWSDIVDGATGAPWPSAPVLREFPAHLAGQVFRHTLTAPCHMEVLAFTPKYRFGEDEE